MNALRVVLISLLVAGAPCLTHAGTTVITHGFQANSTTPPGWAFTMAEAILAADGDPSDCGATVSRLSSISTISTSSRSRAEHCSWLREARF